MPLGSTGRVWRSWGSWITGTVVAAAVALLLFLAWPSIRGGFAPALMIMAIDGAIVALLISGASLLFREPFARLWRNAAAASSVICLAALLTLGVLQAAQVGFLVATSPLPAASTVSNSPASDTLPMVWTEMTPDGGLIARALVGLDAPCPIAEIDGATQPMQQRFAAAPTAFPIRVCQLRTDGARPMRIAGQVLPLRPRVPKRILVFGDSGCRITWYTEQPCADGALWPLRRIAEAAVRTQPDLVIHLGDYHYREKPCSEPRLCGDSPFGDTWAAWSADFFIPAAALLPTAPWVMLRGNHEDCACAGAGWFYFLDIDDTVPQRGCSPAAKAYVLHFDSLDVAVLDTAHAGDTDSDPDRRAKRIAEYEGLYPDAHKDFTLTPGTAWVLVHQPLWSSYGRREAHKLVQPDQPGDLLNSLRQTIRSGPSVGKTVSLVMSGDTHLFQFFGAEKSVPVQLIVGTGGDLLDKNGDFASIKDVEDATLYGVSGRLWTRETFGFVLLTRADPDPEWIATFYDVRGDPVIKCSLSARSCG